MSAARPAAVNGLKNCVTVGLEAAIDRGDEMSAWLTSVMVVKSALKTEMPMPSLMLRGERLVGPIRAIPGERHARVTALIGTKRTPKPAPCTQPGDDNFLR